MPRFLVTAALPYSNGRLHAGHIAGAYLPADIYVRYLRMSGHEVRFICGSDDNGVAALKSALNEHRPVEELTTDYRQRQAAAFKALHIQFDIYAGTHAFESVQPDRPDAEQVYQLHARFSQELFKRIYENGYFQKKTSTQLYDLQAQEFLPDRFVRGTCPNCRYTEANGDQCENCSASLEPTQLIDPVSTLTNTTPVLKDTCHWYMDLNALAPALQRWLSTRKTRQPFAEEEVLANDNPPLNLSASTEAAYEFPWRPTVINFALAQLEAGLPQRAMTRDVKWGVPVPLDDPDAAGKSLYVWFDAPIGYVSFTAVHSIRHGEAADAYTRWWKDPNCNIVNFIGEDNIVFHALTWPAMLLAAETPATQARNIDPLNIPIGQFQLAASVCANSFLNFVTSEGKEVKSSKSRNTAVFIDDYLQRYQPDPLRYYLTAIAPETSRTAFSWSDFINRNNNELVAALGNFVNRYQKILTEHFARKVPAYAEGELNRTDQLLADAALTSKQVAMSIERFEFRRGLERIMEFARACNLYIGERAPWDRVNSKKNLPGKPAGQLDLRHAAETINACIQATRTLGTLITPYMPETGHRIRAMLNLPTDEWRWNRACKNLPPGHQLADAPLLFAKLDPADLTNSPPTAPTSTT